MNKKEIKGSRRWKLYKTIERIKEVKDPGLFNNGYAVVEKVELHRNKDTGEVKEINIGDRMETGFSIF